MNIDGIHHHRLSQRGKSFEKCGSLGQTQFVKSRLQVNEVILIDQVKQPRHASARCRPAGSSRSVQKRLFSPPKVLRMIRNNWRVQSGQSRNALDCLIHRRKEPRESGDVVLA